MKIRFSFLSRLYEVPGRKLEKQEKKLWCTVRARITEFDNMLSEVMSVTLKDKLVAMAISMTDSRKSGKDSRSQSGPRGIAFFMVKNGYKNGL